MLCVRYWVISYMSDRFYIYNCNRIKLIFQPRHQDSKIVRSSSKCETTLEKSSNYMNKDCFQDSGVKISSYSEELKAYCLCLEWYGASTGLLGGLICIPLKDPVWCLTTLGRAKAKFDWAKCKIRRLLSGSNHVYTEHHREWCELECCVAQRDPAGRVEGLQEGELWTTLESGLNGGLARRLRSERLSKRPLRSPPQPRACSNISVAQRKSKWGLSCSDFSSPTLWF